MSVEEKDLVRVRWHADKTKDPVEFMIYCLHPDYPDLKVSVTADEMTERVAKARLMERMYAMAKEKGIEAKFLRFKINGIED